jgi:hypothetical protein
VGLGLGGGRSTGLDQEMEFSKRIHPPSGLHREEFFDEAGMDFFEIDD